MLKEISLSLIDLPPHDLRFYRSREFLLLLARDIQANGLNVPPVLVTKNGRYLVVDGINRISALRYLKEKTVTCIVYEDLPKTEQLIMGLRLNLFRASHDVMGVARAFQALIDMGLRQKDLAERFQMSKGHISKLVSLNKLPPDQKLALAKGAITIDVAYSMIKKHRDREIMERLDIKYECGSCRGKYGFSQILELRLCLECNKKLSDLIRAERRKLQRDRSQKGLD